MTKERAMFKVHVKVACDGKPASTSKGAIPCPGSTEVGSYEILSHGQIATPARPHNWTIVGDNYLCEVCSNE